ncbi:MAG: ZIP family metal transporter [Myxococcales bacterium]|nr:ZIP family metal transporter [Myxococcales bacterium]
MESRLFEVFVYALGTALATGLGALPFILVRRISKRAIAIANATSAGLMLGASFGLLREASRFGTWQPIVGGAVGLLFILLSERALSGRDVGFGALRGAGARQAMLVMLVMTLHSFAEGVAVGVSFGGGAKLGTLITIAIAVHNIPEGLAISASMRPRGASILACVGYSILSSLPQPVMAVPAFLFVEQFRPLLPFGFGFAAGAMVLVVFMELAPESYEALSRRGVGLLVSLALGLMILFQRYL